MANVTGHQKLVKQFRAVADEGMVKAVGKALFVGGQRIEEEAQISITTGSASGTKTKKHKHVPSLPGEPPNNFTGTLANNIEAVQVAPLLVEVSSNAPYSVHLELGTSKMPARPFMGPAARFKKAEALALVNQAIKAQLRKAMKK